MKLKIFFATVATLLFVACTNANKVVEFPLVGTSNTTIPVIEKVELTDTATVLNVRGVFIPNYWIKISSNGHLEAQGRKYKLIGSEGIKPDKELFMPADGDSCFTLFYEPLPKDCKQFNFIEGAGDGDWRIYDIDLTGKRNASAPADLPKKLERKYDREQEPQYAYTFGETTVNIHLLGYREGCTDNIELSINSTFEKQHNIDVKIDPATGKGTAKFVQYGTVSLYPCIKDNVYGEAFVAPNETIDLYINLAFINTILHERKYENDPEAPSIRACWTDGSIYDALNNMDLINISLSLKVPQFTQMEENIRYNMTADEFTDYLLKCYKEICEYVDKQSYHQWIKESFKADCFNTCIHLLNMDYRRWGIREENTPENHKHDSILSKHYERMFASVNLDNQWLLINSQSEDVINAASHIQQENTNDTLNCWRAAYNAVNKAFSNKLTDTELQALRSFSNPFYANMCEDILRRTREAIANSSINLEQVEEIAPQALFQTIIAPHKGKVVLVDFWNTWCGPCRHSIKQMEPHKSGRLAGDEIVWIYIANETSDVRTYIDAIPNIKGIHYRLNDEQWHYLTHRQFHIDGIPSYVLVDKDGKYSLRNDLRDHTKMIDTLGKMIKK